MHFSTAFLILSYSQILKIKFQHALLVARYQKFYIQLEPLLSDP